MQYKIYRENRGAALGSHVVPALPELLTVETLEEARQALQESAEQGHRRVSGRARTPRIA